MGKRPVLLRSRRVVGTFQPRLSSPQRNPLLQVNYRLTRFVRDTLQSAEKIWSVLSDGYDHDGGTPLLCDFPIVDTNDDCGIYGETVRLESRHARELKPHFHRQDYIAIKLLSNSEEWPVICQSYGYLACLPGRVLLVAPERLASAWEERFVEVTMRRLDDMGSERAGVRAVGHTRFTSAYHG